MPSASPSAALLKALHHILRPLVRLMLSRGLTFPALSEMLKKVFVEVADEEFRLEGRAQSDSRISLLTGVHRKDVKRLRHEGESWHARLPEKVSFGAQLVSLWMNEPPFCDEQGQARPLARLARHGGDVSFDALVAHQSTDIRARVVLDEWLRLGLVSINGDDEVVLQSPAFVPSDGGDEQVAYMGHNVHDHVAAAVHNVTGGRPPFFERSVHYDALSPESIQRLASSVQSDGMALLLALNNLAMELEAEDADRRDNDQRMTIGMYFYSTRRDVDSTPDSHE